MNYGKQLVITCFLELASKCFEQTIENCCSLFPLLFFFTSGGSYVCFTVVLGVDKTGKKRIKERMPR